MSITVQEFVVGSVLTGSSIAYGGATPAATKRVIKSATICNTTGSPVVCNVMLGTLSSTATTVIFARAVDINETYNCPELINKVLEVGESIFADGLGLSFGVSGIAIV